MTVRWDRIEALLDASPSLADLRAHGLALLAARHWRSVGRSVPTTLTAEEVGASWRYHAAPAVLERVRAACDGPILLIKGPAVAERYPEPAARPFVDIDLVVPDPDAVQAALLDAGFCLSADPADYPDGLHHLPPVHHPELPIPIEVHGRLKWLDQAPGPSFDMLSAGARSPALGVDGISVPAPAAHVVVLAGHLWAHDPLTRLLRILDVAVMADGVEEDEVQAVADAWGMGRMWRSTSDVADALFGDARKRPWPLRTWARGLLQAREPTVAELHLSRVLSPFAVYEGRAVGRALAAAMRGFARPQDEEGWGRKVRRTARQIARPSMRRSEHVEEIADKEARILKNPRS